MQILNLRLVNRQSTAKSVITYELKLMTALFQIVYGVEIKIILRYIF